MSAVTVFELEFGAKRSGRHEGLMRVIEAFLDHAEVLPCDRTAAGTPGAILADLQAAHTTTGAYDLLIGGPALATGSTLLTNNVREFARVPGLAFENWIEEA